MRVCDIPPTFIGAQEHSDADLQALFDKLAETTPAAAKLSPDMFHANASNGTLTAPGHGASGPDGARGTKRKAVSYRELYPPHLKAKFDEQFARDFQALGYTTSLSCV